ncbi:hypothetical protein EDB83DRAFT_683102 [Lactarius deliciosus]|nr:hypothetical protein EDB83DRAFT_683102 [Lactarius deliciosus]
MYSSLYASASVLIIQSLLLPRLLFVIHRSLVVHSTSSVQLAILIPLLSCISYTSLPLFICLLVDFDAPQSPGKIHYVNSGKTPL